MTTYTDGTERAITDETERLAGVRSMIDGRRAAWLGIVYTAAILGYALGAVTHG